MDSPRTELTPGGAAAVEHCAQVGIKLLIIVNLAIISDLENKSLPGKKINDCRAVEIEIAGFIRICMYQIHPVTYGKQLDNPQR